MGVFSRKINLLLLMNSRGSMSHQSSPSQKAESLARN